MLLTCVLDEASCKPMDLIGTIFVKDRNLMSHTKYKFNLKYLTLTPTDRAYFNSRGMILKKKVEEHYIMVSATYYSSLHYCSKNIFLISIYKYSYIIWHLSLVKLDPPPWA